MTAGTISESAEFREAAQAAQAAYKDSSFDACLTGCAEALASADAKQRPSVKLLKACAYYKLGKFSRALSECSEVLGSGDKKLAAWADQLKGECFLHEDEWDAALEAFDSACSRENAQNKEAVKEFVAATKAASSGTSPIDFGSLEQHSVTSQPPEIVAPKSLNSQAASAKVSQSMARPGPSVKAEDLAEVPFAGNIELLAPKKYRMQFNQNAGMVEVQVFAKQLNKQRERVTVEIGESSLKVEVKDPKLMETEYLLEEKLYQPILVEASKWDVWSTQINIKLKKADGAIVWPDLAYSDAPAVQGGASIVDPSAGRADEYPTSHRKQPRDWGKIETEVKKEEDEEQLDGDAGLQKFFKQLYAGADEDTRRAMNKSFQQSGGTSLSTNWKEVHTKDYDCSPPDGVKVKKFEQ